MGSPGPLIDAAQRYQLLPSVDRWVMQRALQMLTPYRGMLRTRGLSMSINVSGQSIGDETFIQRFTQLLDDANLPRHSISVELTEQEFWQAIQKSQGPKRQPPPRRKAVAKVAEDDVEEDGE